MKRQLIILLITLIPLIGYGQTITLKDISTESGIIDTTKVVALIFAEHEKLSIENPLLKEKVLALEELNQYYEKNDSLQNQKLMLYEEKIKSDAKKYKKLKTFSIIGGILLILIRLI